MLDRTGLGFTNTLYAKDKYRLDKNEIGSLGKICKTLGIKNKSRFIKEPNALDRYIKKYLSHLSENFAPDERIKEEYKILHIRAKIQRYAFDRTHAINSVKKIKEREKIIIALPGNKCFQTLMGPKTDDYFVASYPILDPYYQEIKWKNTRLKVFYNRLNDGQYLFETKAIGSFHRDDQGILRIKNPVKILKRQRRIYPRFDTNLYVFAYPVTVLEKGKQWRLKIHEERKLHATAKNLSAGGILMATNGVFEKNDFVKLDFRLNDRDETLLAKVVRSTFDKKTDKHLVNLQTVKQQPSTKINILMTTFNYSNNN